MRRRPGVAGLQAHGAIASQFREVGAAAQAVEAAELADKVAAFRAHLEAFALNHRAAIQKDPTFRAQFHEMCASVGVDPLASNKGFWAELLGFGDFYYELAVQIGAARQPDVRAHSAVTDSQQSRRALRRVRRTAA